MSVPIQIPWDLFHGKIVVWCECLRAGARRAVLLPKLDTIFAPVEEDPAREQQWAGLDWRLVSPTETDWDHYTELVRKQADRAAIGWTAQRVEAIARWVNGRSVAAPQYHLWLYADDTVRERIEALYDETDPARRREHWQWLLTWTAPAGTETPTV
jgi:hypothetical protein